MVINFDAYENVEDLTLILCNPGCYISDGMLRRAVAAIPYVTDVEFIKKYNSMTELNFRVYCVEDGNEDRDRMAVEAFNLIEKNKYVHISGEYGYSDMDAFFRITECNYTCDGDVKYKDVKALSRECELTTRNIPYIPSGVYKLAHKDILDQSEFVLGYRFSYMGDITTSTSCMTVRNRSDAEKMVGGKDGAIHFYHDTRITPSSDVKICVFAEDDTQSWTSDPITVKAGTDATINVTYVDGRAISSVTDLMNEFVVEELDTILRLLFDGTDWDFSVNQTDYAILNNKVRSFDGVSDSMSIYDFLIEKVQPAFECVFTFKEGSYHGEAEYGYKYQTGIAIVTMYDEAADPVSPTDEHIFISNDTFVVSGSISAADSDVYTAMRGSGEILDSSTSSSSGFGTSSTSSDKKFTIAAVNPTGTSIIYDFSRYYDWMSDDLKQACMDWADTIASNEEQYINSAKAYYGAAGDVNNIQLDIDMYNIQKDIYTKCKNNLESSQTLYSVPTYNEQLIAMGLDPLEYSMDTVISELSDEIDSRIAEIDAKIAALESQKSPYETIMNTNKAIMDGINEDCAMENNFTTQQFYELIGYINEAEYNDEFVAYSEEMPTSEQIDAVAETYRRTKNALKIASQPVYQYTLDINGYMFISSFREQALALTNVGKVIHVDIDGSGYQTLFITEMSYNFEDKSCSITVASTLVKSDIRSLFRSVFDNISSAYTTQYKLTSR